jgi:hypothetical protein
MTSDDFTCSIVMRTVQMKYKYDYCPANSGLVHKTTSINFPLYFKLLSVRFAATTCSMENKVTQFMVQSLFSFMQSTKVTHQRIWKISKKYSKICNKITTCTQYQLQDTTVSNKRSSENHSKLKVYGYYLGTATVYVDCTKIYVEDELRYSFNI